MREIERCGHVVLQHQAVLDHVELMHVRTECEEKIWIGDDGNEVERRMGWVD